MSGRRIVLAIIVAFVVLDAFTTISYLMVFGPDRLPYQSLRFVLTVGLCVFLYRGANWARRVTVVLFGLAGLAGLSEGIGLGGGGGLLLIVMGLFYVASVIVLLFVPTVRAYFSAKSGPLSMVEPLADSVPEVDSR